MQNVITLDNTPTGIKEELTDTYSVVSYDEYGSGISDLTDVFKLKHIERVAENSAQTYVVRLDKLDDKVVIRQILSAGTIAVLD